MRHNPFVKRLNHYPDIRETYVVIAAKLQEASYLKKQKLCRPLQNHDKIIPTLFFVVIFRCENVNLSSCIVLAFNWYYNQNIFILLKKIKESLEVILWFFFLLSFFFSPTILCFYHNLPSCNETKGIGKWKIPFRESKMSAEKRSKAFKAFSSRRRQWASFWVWGFFLHF